MKRLLILFLVFNVFVSNAQILNTEKFRLDKDTANVFLGIAEAGMSAKKQKTNVFSVNGKLNVDYLARKHNYMLLSYLNLIKVASANVISEGYAHLRMNFYRKKMFSFEQFNQVQYDVGRGMNWRGLVGANLRFRVKSTENWEFSMNTGLMFEDETWDEGGVSPTFVYNQNLKSTSNVTLRIKFNKVVSFLMISYYQASFDHFFRPRWISDASVVFHLTERTQLRSQFVSFYDADPVINIDKLIYSMNSTLVYKFK